MKKFITCSIISAVVLLSIPIISTFAYSEANENFNELPTIEGNSLILPEAPEGWSLELFGSDRKEVIAMDGKVTNPIQDVHVNLIYKLKKDGKKDIVTKNVTIPVSKRTDLPTGTNKKPDVIPAIREWAGGEGNYTLNDDTTIVIADNSLMPIAEVFQNDLAEITQKTFSITVGEPGENDIYLHKDNTLEELGEEGYYIDNNTNSYIDVIANDDKGLFYGTVTLMQILKLDESYTNIPKGIIRDYPKYETRGMMMDVARKYIPLEFLDDYVKYLSWYKMSDIEIHLNDNEIFGDTANRPYPVSGDEPYYAFRLESNIEGLTSTDGSYTKDEFRQFQKDAAKLGVNVIPEIDVPGHSMALTKVRPDLMLVDPTSYKGASYDHVEKYLDVRNPETIPFVQGLFDEYMDGENPVFVGKDVHFGTDEYSNSYDTENINAGFREFANQMIDYIRKKPHYNNGVVDGTYNANLWGGYSRYGSQNVNTNATIFNWNQGFANPIDMVDLGFNIINIDDRNLYIVPGMPVETAYPQSLNNSDLYNNWEPIKFVGKTPFASGHPQVKGGMFAIWNDNHGNGKSVVDLYEVSKQSVQVLADKNWSGDEGKNQRNYDAFIALGEKLADAPNADLDHKVNAENNVVLNADFNESLTKNTNDVDGANIVETSNVSLTEGKVGTGASFQGGQSFIKTDIEAVGFGWTAEMWIHPDQNNENDAILMESNPASNDLHTSIKLKQGTTNKIGFSVENYDHYFDYELMSGQWTHIALTGDAKGTSLYVNGVLQERLEGKQIPNGNYPDPKYYETLQLPIEYIGSTTNAFTGVLDDVIVYNTVRSVDQIIKDAGIIYNEDIGNVALNKTVMSENVDYANPPHRVISSLTDGVITTSVDNRWAPHVSGTSQKDYRFVIDFGSEKAVNKAVLFERIFTAPSAVNHVSVQRFIGDVNDATAWKNDKNWEDVTSLTGPLSQTGTTLNFDTTSTRMIRFIVKTSAVGDSFKDVSLMEVEVYGSSPRAALSEALNEAVRIYNMISSHYTDTDLLETAIRDGSDALTNQSLSEAEVSQIVKALKDTTASSLQGYRNLNIAKEKNATASGKEANLDRLAAAGAFDGDYTDMSNGRWSSETGNDNAWIQVDLGRLERINQVNIWWETAYAKKFILQVSEDGVNYQDVYTQKNGIGGTELITFEPVTARYVKMQGVQRRTDNPVVQTYSIFEMEVFRSGPIETTNIDLGEAFKLLPDTSKTLVPVFTPADATDIAVVYSSSDESIVRVDEQGVVYAQQPGNVVISATLKSNEAVSDSVEVTVITPADKSLLASVLKDADRINDYVLNQLDPSLVNRFQAALKETNRVQKDTLATQADVDSAIVELQTCIHAIQSEDMDAMLTRADTILNNINQYEETGKAELQVAYEEANVLRDDSSSSYEDMEIARKNLKTAIQHMVMIDTDALLNEWKVAKLYDLSKFTDASKTGFDDAFANAEACLQQPISADHVKDIRLQLNQQVNSLRYIPTKVNFIDALNNLSSLDVQVMMTISDIFATISDVKVDVSSIISTMKSSSTNVNDKEVSE